MANRGTFASGLTVGAIAGLTIGLLIAPRTGRENRQTLQKSARALPELGTDLASSLQFQTDRAVALAQHRWGDTLGRLRQSVAAGLAATQQEFHATVRAAARTPDGSAIASGTQEISNPSGTCPPPQGS